MAPCNPQRERAHGPRRVLCVPPDVGPIQSVCPPLAVSYVRSEPRRPVVAKCRGIKDGNAPLPNYRQLQLRFHFIIVDGDPTSLDPMGLGDIDLTDGGLLRAFFTLV
jgi:hypothetical protein